jgi:hypothetical protein
MYELEAETEEEKDVWVEVLKSIAGQVRAAFPRGRTEERRC